MSDWIKCSDSLPELEDKLVLVFSLSGGAGDVGSFGGFPAGGHDCVSILDYFKDITDGKDDEGNQKYTKWYLSQGITHWMPYPEPPIE